jgi:hypothetical protein
MEPTGAHRALSTAVKSSDRKSRREGEMLTGLVREVPRVTLVLVVDEMESDSAEGSLPSVKWICGGSVLWCLFTRSQATHGVGGQVGKLGGDSVA